MRYISYVCLVSLTEISSILLTSTDLLATTQDKQEICDVKDYIYFHLKQKYILQILRN